MFTNRKKTLSVIEHKPQAAAESSIIKADSAQFGETPLVSSKTCLNLIDALLKFLKVFCIKDSAAVQKHIDNIIKTLWLTRGTYDSIGGLFAMADNSKWIVLNNDSKKKIFDAKVPMGPPFVQKLFLIDSVQEFIKLHVKSKYKIKTKAEKNIHEENIPLALTAAVYQLLEFNSLPPKARLYGETHHKDIISANETQLPQLRANIEAMINLLIEKKGSSSRLSEIMQASSDLTSHGNASAAAYNLFIQEQSKQLVKIITPEPDATNNMSEPEREPEGDTQQQDTRVESIPGDMQEGSAADNRLPQVEISGCDVIGDNRAEGEPLPEEPAAKDQAVPITTPPEPVYDKDFLEIVVNSLATYLKKNLGKPSSTFCHQLFASMEAVQIAIQTKSQNLIDEKFNIMRKQVANILKLVNTSSPKHFQSYNLEVILKENLAKHAVDEMLKITNTRA